jgi:hypothetical protein
MLGTLADRLDAQGQSTSVPAYVQRHFDAIRATVAYRHQMARVELQRVTQSLAPLQIPIIVCKGAAYVIQGLACGAGRLFADVDIIVPRARIDEVEQTLLSEGWESETQDAYDQHYYRAWSHELPPMRFANHPLELDVHHTILPLTGRVQPNVDAMFAQAQSVPGWPQLKVLSPEDQILHACAHLFQDSDLSDRLRELADIDGLLRAYCMRDNFWPQLAERARIHQLGRPLYYGLRYATAWFGTPAPAEAAKYFAAFAPNRALSRWMDQLVGAALPPADPNRLPPRPVRIARLFLYIRSLWLRMPPWLLLRHLFKKGLRRIGSSRDARETHPVAL